MMKRLPLFLLLLPVVLASCGDLPLPFRGNPGATARRLATPLTPILAVAPPTDALLPQGGSQDLADQLAETLQEGEVPAMARIPHATDWRLETRARRAGGAVQPVFEIFDPKGESQGSIEGKPVPLSAWYGAAPATLKQVATDAGPRIVAMLTSIRIAREMADPNSLYNRPAKVQVADVTGAPGDGNLALTRQMRDQLVKYGPLLVSSATAADFIVQGEVKLVAIPVKQQRVEVQWIIKTATGDERGRVIQLNEIPAGFLDRFWGDVAYVVAAEAAAGINDVLQRQAGKEPKPDPAAAPPPADKAAGSAAAAGR